MFTYEKRISALQMYEGTHSVTNTIRALGYPGRQTLYKWIGEQNQPKQAKSTYRGENTPAHPRHPPSGCENGGPPSLLWTWGRCTISIS